MNGLAHAVASIGQTTRLGRGAKGRPHEIDRGRDWLCPEGNYSHRMVDLRMVGDKAVLLDKVAGEFGESIPLAVTVKDRAEDIPKKGIAVRGSAARPVLHADVHHAAHERAHKMKVGNMGGGL